MAASYTTSNNINFKPKPNYPSERRPRMLKDFLADDSNSCSSSDFKSFPRRPKSTQNPLPPVLQRSRSKAASSTISALHAVLGAVRKFHSLAAVKSPAAILPRSLSRRLSKTVRSHEQAKKITVTIRDIIRWRSFRDLGEDECHPQSLQLNLASSPLRCTTASTSSSTTTTVTTPCSSSGSSWCDSDFTAEELPRWGVNNSGKRGEKCCLRVGVVKDPAEAMARSGVNATVGPEQEVEYEFEDEEEQQSPVSVLDIEYEEDEEVQAGFKQSLANVERPKQKLTQKIRRLESLAKWEPLNLENLLAAEEITSSVEQGCDDDGEFKSQAHHELEEEINEVERKARQLLEHVKSTTSLAGSWCLEKLLLGFFTEALMAASSGDNIGIDKVSEVLERAESWINGGALKQERSCVYERALEDGGRWSKFREEEEELATAIESQVTGSLVDELVADMFFFLL